MAKAKVYCDVELKRMKSIRFTTVFLVLLLVYVDYSSCCTSNDLTKLAEYQFVFKDRAIKNVFLLENAIKDDLNAFTLSFFVKLEQGAGEYQCVFSYATPESTYGNGIYVCMTRTIQIDIANNDRVTNVKIDDNLMHHISVTWENCEGNWQLFVDGKLAERGTGFMKDHVIPHGGTAVIGNDQDKMGGGFEMRDAFGPGESYRNPSHDLRTVSIEYE
ncbi:hypothetical protein OS493_027615 [Desmophyllum pertusum]|uniref:Pentraxin family member n=1 Tax=Desmophyllum pertusum TaxID=174260 RepID=A0A9W9ZP01_9CNID|nr:hypothetical protein OS493_027615 [Desmophyllum pertusum]